MKSLIIFFYLSFLVRPISRNFWVFFEKISNMYVHTLLFLFLFSVKSMYTFFISFVKLKSYFISYFSCTVWKSRQKYCHVFTEKSKFFSQTNCNTAAVSAINFMNFLWIQGFFVPFVGIFREFNDFFFILFHFFFWCSQFLASILMITFCILWSWFHEFFRELFHFPSFCDMCNQLYKFSGSSTVSKLKLESKLRKQTFFQKLVK